jgi:TolB-like protein
MLAQAVRGQIDRFEHAGRWVDARGVADAFLGRDPLDETVVAAAIRADMALGDTTSAHRRFHSLETALEKEFNAAPGALARDALNAPGGQSVGEPPNERFSFAPPAKPSIAVLPFKNLSGDPEKEYFADAITEDIVAMLSRWRWFFVIASNSSFNFKGRDINPSQLGNDLGVRYLLEGGIRTISNRVRVVAQLIDVVDGTNVWAERFDREVTDILAIQDEITEQVVAAIEPAILHREGARASPKSLTDFSALDCFYRGMWHLNTVSQAGYGEAVRLFREAIARDPLLPQGHIGLARILFGGAIFGWSGTQEAHLREARDSARRAIGMDGRDACAYFACAGASLYLGDHGAALEEARSAISLNPNFAPAQARLGQVLVFSGHPADAVAPLERFLRLSPYDSQLAVILESLALAHYHARNYEQAVITAKAAMHRNHSKVSAILAASLAQLGRQAEAAAALPQTPWAAATTQRPLAAPYADQTQLDHLRQGVRLARAGGPRQGPS